MGTTFQVKVVTGRYESLEGLAEKIGKRLLEINRSMSTYIEDSEISRFNRFNEVNRPFPVSVDFLRVMQSGKKVHRLSAGAWDATVAPLVDLWGFGPSDKTPSVPPAAQLRTALKTVGFSRIDILPSGQLIKTTPGTTLDFGSIAKGYGADQIAALLRSAGHSHFLVEIGGEVVASGVRSDGLPWRVGINTPKPGASVDAVYRAFSLSDAAFATSGDYRNFFVMDGVRYSHVIDPRTGYPVANGVVSATIIAPDCTLADGLATAVMVMGAGKGLALIDRLEGVEGLIVVADAGGRLTDFFSEGLESHR
jgi:thiamine biosynthesis lipoprotein